MTLTLPPSIQVLRLQLGARWKSLAPRERNGLLVASAVLGLFLVWSIAVGPALRTLREAPAQLDRLDAQIQQMQRLAAEARELRSATGVSAIQSATALKTATDNLGERARLSLLGDRATLTLNGVDAAQLRQWLSEARSGARAQPVDVQLSRTPSGFNGTIVVRLGGAS